MNELELYNRLTSYLLPQLHFEDYRCPIRDPKRPGMRQKPSYRDLRTDLTGRYNCRRCKDSFDADSNGIPLNMKPDGCRYHNGRWNWDGGYSCCKGAKVSRGCQSNEYHAHDGDFDVFNFEGYVETVDKPEREPDRHGIYAIDCEMCDTVHGLELIRVSIIDHKFCLIYNRLVRPRSRILNYNTVFSGITKEQVDATSTTLADVQHDLLKIFSSKSILIGHGLGGDMRALKMLHTKLIDTVHLFPHPRGMPYKMALSALVKERFGIVIQSGHHDSEEDAKAALRLVLLKVGK